MDCINLLWLEELVEVVLFVVFCISLIKVIRILCVLCCLFKVYLVCNVLCKYVGVRINLEKGLFIFEKSFNSREVV